jgi:hypothetical protein
VEALVTPHKNVSFLGNVFKRILLNFVNLWWPCFKIKFHGWHRLESNVRALGAQTQNVDFRETGLTVKYLAANGDFLSDFLGTGRKTKYSWLSTFYYYFGL